MKTQIKISLLILILIMSQKGYSQSTKSGAGGNFRIAATDFLGWDNFGFAGPLNIRNDFNQPIIFSTGGLEKMRIYRVNTGSPLIQVGPSGVSSIGSNGLTRVAISYDSNLPITVPQSILHMGERTNGPGIRDWMGLGMLLTKDDDNAFFGHRQKSPADLTGRTSMGGTTGNDNNDAVIAWGDNAAGPVGPGTDNLTFIFNDANTGVNSITGPNFQNSPYGREVMRITGLGNVGIGPVFFDNAQPQNLFHMNNSAANAAYLQVTNQINTGQAGGDGFLFGITGAGVAEINQQENLDLRLYTFGLQRAVIKNSGLIGFNTNTPNNELEITSRAITPYGLTGSGLRFTNLTSTNTVIPNGVNGVNSSRVLTVDANGDVVLTNPTSTVASNNGVYNNAGVLQLGVPCSSPIGTKVANGLTTSRMIHLLGNNFVFADGGRVGFGLPPINTCVVRNKVEIRSTGLDPYFSNIFGWGASGLRLSNLTAANNPVPNGTNGTNYTKVLSVDGNGDVVIIPNGAGASGLGNICGGVANPLVNNWDIPLNNKNFVFSEPITTGNYTNNNVGIGTSCSPAAKLEVISKPTTNTINPITIKALNNDLASSINFTGDAFGIHTTVNNQNLNNRGYYADVNNAKFNFGYVANVAGNFGGILANNNTENTGVYSFAANSTKNIGVYGIGEDGISYPFSVCYGGLFHGRYSTNTNIGVAGLAGGPSFFNPPFSLLQTDVAVFGNVANTNVINYAGYFVGDVYVNGGTNSLTGYLVASDQMFKTNIDTIANVQNIIKQLKPKTFYYDTANVYKIHFSNKKQYGLIAQDVQTVLPELVGTVTKPAEADSTGNVKVPSVTYKNLNYDAFIALLIKGMQQQQKTIDAYKAKDSIHDARLAALEAAINTCCANANVRTNNSNTLNQTNIELSDKEIIVLNQNVPNPFAEQTTITYNVPEKYGFAQIIFNTSDGRIIKTVDLTKKGRGQLTVFANDLSNGMYAYSLVVDGKVVDTKKMVKQ